MYHIQPPTGHLGIPPDARSEGRTHLPTWQLLERRERGEEREERALRYGTASEIVKSFERTGGTSLSRTHQKQTDRQIATSLIINPTGVIISG